jgi:hypothetical protein
MIKKIFSFKKNIKSKVNAPANFPNVVCIGTQKAGTTWLYEIFNQHPDVEFAVTDKNKVRKEVHFWDLFYDKGLDWYKSLFKQGKPIRCDITPAYCILGEKKLEQFHQILPSVKLLLIVRNPIDRAWSLALMNLKNQGLGYDDVDDQWFIDQFNDMGSFSRGDYPTIIKNWRSFYSNEQLLILNYDELVQNPKEFLFKVCDHFGINKAFYLSQEDTFFKKRVFGSEAIRMNEKQHAYLLEKYAHIIKETGDLLSWDVKAWQYYNGASENQTNQVTSVKQTNSLKNTGIAVLGDQNLIKSNQKTIIVVGVARGGTSMVAGSLHHLGFFGGERSGPPVYEDVSLAEAFENKDTKRIQELISLYNRNHDTWFFKRPSVIDYLDEIHHKVRNPVFIFIFKDIFTVSNRNNISMQQDILKGLSNAQNDYAKILKFLSKNNNINGVLVSYEKALLHTREFVDELTSTLFKSGVSSTKKQKLLSFIEPAPEHYLDSSRKTKVVGTLEMVTEERLTGWAKTAYSTQNVCLHLYINGHLIDKTHANQNLTYLAEEHQGYGFIFELKKPLKTGDLVAVRAEGEVNDLKGTPFTFQFDSVLNDQSFEGENPSSNEPLQKAWLVTDATGLAFDYLGQWIGNQTKEGQVLYDDGINSPLTSDMVAKSYQSGDMVTFWNEFNRDPKATFILVKSQPQKYLGLVSSVDLACFFSEPVNLVLRSFEFNKRFKGFGGTLAEFVQMPQYRNMQSRHLNSIPIQFLGSIGVLEELDKSVQIMSSTLKLSDEEFDTNELKAEVLSKQPKDKTEQNIKLIEKYNQQDIELYKAAVIELTKRYEVLTDNQRYAHGFIQSQNLQRVVGCAVYADSQLPVTIEVYVNEELIKTIKATERRPGLAGFNLPRHGYVGFSYNFTKPLLETDVCVFKVAGSGQVI